MSGFQFMQPKLTQVHSPEYNSIGVLANSLLHIGKRIIYHTENLPKLVMAVVAMLGSIINSQPRLSSII